MPRGDRLFTLLEGCSDRQLEALWTVDLRMKPHKNGYEDAPRRIRRDLISAELRSAAGHSVANLTRSPHGLYWSDIVDGVSVALAATAEESRAFLERTIGEYQEAGSVGIEARERIVLALADLRVRSYLSEAREVLSILGIDPDAPVQLDKVHVLARFEDSALRDVNPSKSAIDDIALFGGGAAGAFFGAIFAPAALGGGALLGLRAMRPAYKKVVPATVRLLQANAVEPHPLLHSL